VRNARMRVLDGAQPSLCLVATKFIQSGMQVLYDYGIKVPWQREVSVCLIAYFQLKCSTLMHLIRRFCQTTHILYVLVLGEFCRKLTTHQSNCKSQLSPTSLDWTRQWVRSSFTKTLVLAKVLANSFV